MYIFNWTTHVQKGHMSFYPTILHWQLVGRRKNSFLEDRTYLRSAAVSRVKPGFIGHFFEIATSNSDITGCRRIG